MEVSLRGNSPSTTTAAIMLLTKARQLGYRLSVSIVGNSEEVTPVPGPAVVYAPVLASCGVGRQRGSGATVVVSGPPERPLMATLQPHGVGGWFFIDRTGSGSHIATQSFLSLCRHHNSEHRQLGHFVRLGLEAVGMPADPTILDVLFGAEVPTLTRLAVALRAGRAMTGGRGDPVTRFISPTPSMSDPLPPSPLPDALESLLSDKNIDQILDGLSPIVHTGVSKFLDISRSLQESGETGHLPLIYQLAEIASHLGQLPAQSILPPLGAAEDSVAIALSNALNAHGDGDANRQLGQVFRFLGGKYTEEDEHTRLISDTTPPESHIGRWEWFCTEVRIGRKVSEELWPQIVDPPQ